MILFTYYFCSSSPIISMLHFWYQVNIVDGRTDTVLLMQLTAHSFHTKLSCHQILILLGWSVIYSLLIRSVICSLLERSITFRMECHLLIFGKECYLVVSALILNRYLPLRLRLLSFTFAMKLDTLKTIRFYCLFMYTIINILDIIHIEKDQYHFLSFLH